ncbi:hypothetical protein B0H11DRAFT_1973018 [Mycena galericulata]|nr:hypothetical protein B0H11DRAFT_1973018 [Mycena galericulata]
MHAFRASSTLLRRYTLGLNKGKNRATYPPRAKAMKEAFMAPDSNSALSEIVTTGRLPTSETDFQETFGAKIARCEGILQHEFRGDKTLCAEALNAVRGVYPPRCRMDDGRVFVVPWQKRMAVFGDAVLQMHLARIWLDSTAPDETGLQWWRIAKDLPSDEHLISVCRTHGLDECIHFPLSSGLRTCKPKTLATTVEALLAAVYMEGREEALGPVMRRLGLTDHIYLNKGPGEFVSDERYHRWRRRRNVRMGIGRDEEKVGTTGVMRVDGSEGGQFSLDEFISKMSVF